MSEYLEAISRLNAPERTPGVNIPRSLYLPPKNTAKHMNKIMRETLNTPLPKYSIPQTCFINKSDQDFFEFELDKQFTLAKGGRKSIAIRKINCGVDADYNDYFTDERDFLMDFKATVTGIYMNGGTVVRVITKEITHSNTFDNIGITDISGTLKAYFVTDKFQQVLRTELGNDKITVTKIAEDGDKCSFSVVCTDYIIGFKSIELSVSSDEVDLDRFINYTTQPITITNGDAGCQLDIDFSTMKNTEVEHLFVASTLNPWSSGNIIGYFQEDFTSLNRIFPYDNSQTFKVWFVTDRGKILRNVSFVSGFIELELIIDNQNSFAIDD